MSWERDNYVVGTRSYVVGVRSYVMGTRCHKDKEALFNVTYLKQIA